MNIIDIYQKFPTEESCISAIKSFFYKEGLKCKTCQTPCKKELKDRWYCNPCRKYCYIRNNTPFEKIKTSLPKTFVCAALISFDFPYKSIISTLKQFHIHLKFFEKFSNKKEHDILILKDFLNYILHKDTLEIKSLANEVGSASYLEKPLVKRNKMKPTDPLKVIESTHTGTLHISGKDVPCAVLKDGSRIILQKSVFETFERPSRGSRISDKHIMLPSFLAAKSLLPYIDEETRKMFDPIFYKDANGFIKKGYKAEILPVMCEIYLEARKDNALKHNQKKLGEISECLIRSFAKTGIVALVDEATGYQYVREKNALEAILNKYISKELAAWVKRFPDDFYKEIFRLKKWNWDFKKRTGHVGFITKDIVYERLAPDMINELQTKNIKKETGKRIGKHHQFLTETIGIPSLSQHLHAVIGLMRASDTWPEFYKLLQRSFPKKTLQSITSMD